MSVVRVIRRASRSDVPFLVRAICAAESLDDAEGRTMYEAVYGITRAETEAFLEAQLESDHPGHPLSHATFHVVEAAGVPEATCASWIEDSGTRASGLRVAMAMSRFLGTARFNGRREAIGVVAAAAPRRTPGALQLESFYTVPAARGARLASWLIDEALRTTDASGRLAEIALLAGNEAALAAYRRAGFTPAWRTPAGADAFRALTGHSGFVQVARVPLLPSVPTP